MIFNANDYLKRNLEYKKKPIENNQPISKKIDLYMSILKGFKLSPANISFLGDEIIIHLGSSDLDNRDIKNLAARIDTNFNLIIQFSFNSDNNSIIYNIGFDGNHYEISIEYYNYYPKVSKDKYSGFYYINKDIHGTARYKFYDYKSVEIILKNLTNYDSSFRFNPNLFYYNGFNPDYSTDKEFKREFTEEDLACELHDFLHTVTFESSRSFFEKLLSNYEEKEPEKNLLLK